MEMEWQDILHFLILGITEVCICKIIHRNTAIFKWEDHAAVYLSVKLQIKQ